MCVFHLLATNLLLLLPVYFVFSFFFSFVFLRVKSYCRAVAALFASTIYWLPPRNNKNKTLYSYALCYRIIYTD